MDAPPPDEERLAALRQLVNRLVQADIGPLAEPPPDRRRGSRARPYYADLLHAKLDILERALQALRLDVHHLGNRLDLDWFLGSSWSVDSEEGLTFTVDGGGAGLPDAIPAHAYQPLLLIFLLLYDRRHHSVAGILHEFTERVWNQLGPRDFDRLSSGRTRCATNIQFAARDLRGVLLLRSDREVSHKTWALSFLGFIVAARLLGRYTPWQFETHETEGHGSSLHNHVCDALHAPGGFVEFAHWLTQEYGHPQAGKYPVLRKVLGQAYAVALRYREAVGVPKLNSRQLVEQGRHYLREFIELPQYERFMAELSDYMMESTTFLAARKKWGVG